MLIRGEKFTFCFDPCFCTLFGYFQAPADWRIALKIPRMDFFFFVEFIWVTFVNEFVWVSGVHHSMIHHLYSVSCIRHPKSPSITISSSIHPSSSLYPSFPLVVTTLFSVSMRFFIPPSLPMCPPF